jgi:hypothetical protein
LVVDVREVPRDHELTLVNGKIRDLAQQPVLLVVPEGVPMCIGIVGNTCGGGAQLKCNRTDQSEAGARLN